MIRSYLIALVVSLLLILVLGWQSSATYPSNYFRNPVNGALRISGTFGELRPHHFHTGLDIKGTIGQPVLASAEGYIARIRISPDGYGRVLYLNHPNGYTTVYAHLHRFASAIEKYATSEQYRQRQFEVDLELTPGQIPVKKGDIIGKIGVSGRSFGPHLHFEVRSTRSDEPINPLLFGIAPPDHRAPHLQSLKLYSLQEDGTAQTLSTHQIRKYGRQHQLAEGDTLYTDQRKVAFSVNTFDQLDKAPNRNGVFEILLFDQDKLSFHTRMESIHFSQLRYLNAHLDYEAWKGGDGYFHRCYLQAGNRLRSIYPAQDGVIELSGNERRKIQLLVRDYMGNESVLNFWIRHREATPPPPNHSGHRYLLPYQEVNFLQEPNLQLKFPRHTFYSTTYLAYSAERESSYQIYSDIHRIHQPQTPVHQYFELAIKPSQEIPESLQSKAFIARCDEAQQIINCGGEWKEGWLYTQARELGDYFITVDDQPPSIRPVSFRPNMKGRTQLIFEIEDQYETAGNTEGLRYQAFIDEQWVCFEYDAKTRRISHTLSSKRSTGQHHLLIEVVDAVGNARRWEADFSR